MKSLVPLIFDIVIFLDVMSTFCMEVSCLSDLLFNARLVIKWCKFAFPSLNTTSIEQALECAWYVFITVDSAYCQNVYVYVLHVLSRCMCVCYVVHPGLSAAQEDKFCCDWREVQAPRVHLP